MFTGSAVLVAVVHYCNFCQLSSWMRSSLATVVGAGPLLLLYISLCRDRCVLSLHAALASISQGSAAVLCRCCGVCLHHDVK